LDAVVGIKLTLSPCPPPQGAGYRVTIIDFPDFDAQFNGINDAGDIVGAYSDPSTGTYRGFLLRNGSFTIIDGPDAVLTWVAGINNAGQMVGIILFEDPIAQQFVRKGFIRSPAGGFTLLDGHPGTLTRTLPNQINDQGQVVGTFFHEPHFVGPRPIGFLYHNGGYAGVAVPGANETWAYGINNTGDIVGLSVVDSPPGQGGGFLLSGGLFTTLNPLTYGGLVLAATGINDAGDIVGGISDFTGSHAFLLREGTLTRLPVSGGFGGWAEARGINNCGHIVGTVFDEATLRSYGFLAVP
jgi:uncharacterized membrane protein